MEITEEEKSVLLAFFAAFDELTGQWSTVEEVMREDWGIEDPETATENLRNKLMGN